MYLNEYRHANSLGALTQDQYITLMTQRTMLVSQISSVQAQRANCPTGGEGEYQQCTQAIDFQLNQLNAQLSSLDAQLSQGVTQAPLQPQTFTPSGGPIVPDVTASQATPGGAGMPFSPLETEVQTFTGNAPMLPGELSHSATPDAGGKGLLWLALAVGAAVFGG